MVTIKWILILHFLAPFPSHTVTESLGDYATESLCHAAASAELGKRATVWEPGRNTGLYENPKTVRGAWIATCEKVEQ